MDSLSNEQEQPVPHSICSSSAALSPILSLPDELMLNVMCDATVGSFICLSQTSRRFRYLAQDWIFERRHKWMKTELVKQKNIAFIQIPRGMLYEYPTPLQYEPYSERKVLREILQRDMFCDECLLRHRPGSKSLSSKTLNIADIFEERECSECTLRSGGVERHPAWQLHANLGGHIECFHLTGEVRFCPHVAWRGSDFTRTYQMRCQTTSFEIVAECHGCSMTVHSYHHSPVFTAQRVGYVEFQTSSKLYSALKYMDGTKLAGLISQSRIAASLYICPHQDVSEDGRLYTELGRLLNLEAEYIRRFGGHWLTVDSLSERRRHSCCKYCDTGVSLEVRPLSDFRTLEIRLKVQRGLYRNNRSKWLNSLELPSTHFRQYDKLEHIVWCRDTRCKTNNGSRFAPVLLLEQGIALTSGKGWYQAGDSGGFIAAGFPISWLSGPGPLLRFLFWLTGL